MAQTNAVAYRLPPNAAARLIRVTREFGPKAKVRRLGSWKSKTDRELWFYFLYQVMVAGGSASVRRMEASGDHSLLAYKRLCDLSISEQKRLIHRLFREHGVRWAGRTHSSCRKTYAVVCNLQVFREHNGPKAYIEEICQKNRPFPPTAQIARDFKYIKLKGSQDLAAELGLSKNAIALDVRVLAVLKAAGAKVPKGVQSSLRQYSEVCQALLQEVCKPAGIDGYRFDRAMYQFNDEILMSLRK